MATESKTYHLYEAQKALQDAIEKCADINAKYTYLIELVKEHGDPAQLPDDLIQGLQDDLNGTNAKVPTYQARLDAITELIDKLEAQDEESEKLRDIIDKVFMALGIDAQ